MKPIEHAKLHARKYGGVPKDYVDIDDFLDSSKACHGTMKHRALFHHTLGTFVVERLFGHELTNSDGKCFSPRQIAEDHIIQDLGWLPSPDDWLKNMEMKQWYGNPITVKKEIRLTSLVD